MIFRNKSDKLEVKSGGVNDDFSSSRENRKRFPEDFMFRLTKDEKEEVVTNCDHLKVLKFSPQLPYAFTEHGALMLANVIKSTNAIKMSIAIVRAFVKLREIAITHKDLKRKIEAMEKKYDRQFKVVFEAIRKLLEPLPTTKKRIGFHPSND